MSCTIGGPNVKSLAKAIHALSRIGDDVFIESLPTGLVFRTVNSSRSAYVCFTFKPEFFVEYKENTNLKCKVSLKSCIMAFRSIPTLEKTVEECLLDTGSIDCTLLIEFRCKHDLMKIYHLPFIENETVQATFQKQQNPCELTAQTRLLSDGIQNFSSAVEEVTLTVSSAQVTLKNYVENDMEQSKVVHTELTLEAEEFENYEVEQDVDITFCLKELKAILNFAEGCIISISCQRGGKPIIFTIEGIYGLESEFVLATLADKGSQMADSQRSCLSVSQEPLRPPSTSVKNGKRNERNSKSKGKSKMGAYANVLTTSASGSGSAHPQNSNPIHSQRNRVNNGDDDLHLANDLNHFAVNLDDDDDDDAIASTPPAKRQFRSDFLGLSSASQYTSMLPDTDEVLVANSDEDS